MSEDYQKYIRSKEFKELLEKYQQFIHSDGTGYFDADDLLDIAEYYHQKKNDDESMRAAQYCAALFPENEKAQVFIAFSYLISGDIERAEDIAREIPSDNLVDTVYLRAELLLCREKYEEADKYLRCYYDSLTESASPFDDDEEKEDKMLYFPLDVALMLVDYNQLDSAEKWLSMVNDKEVKRNANYLECKAKLLTIREKFADAIPVWNDYIDEDAYSNVAWMHLSHCYFHTGNTAEALRCAQYAEAIDANFPETYLAQGNCYYSLGQPEAALEKFNKYLEFIPDDVQGELLMAYTLNALERFDEAYEHILIAMAQIDALNAFGESSELPDFLCVEVYSMAAYILSALGRTEEAIGCADRLLFYGNTANKMQLLKATIMLEAKRVDEAFAILTALLNESNHDPEVYISVGCMLVDSELYDTGYKLLKEVLAILSDSGNVSGAGYDRLAYSALMTDHYDDFVDALRISCNSLPSETATIFSTFFPEEMPVSEYVSYATNNRITPAKQ